MPLFLEFLFPSVFPPLLLEGVFWYGGTCTKLLNILNKSEEGMCHMGLCSSSDHNDSANGLDTYAGVVPQAVPWCRAQLTWWTP